MDLTTYKGKFVMVGTASKVTRPQTVCDQNRSFFENASIYDFEFLLEFEKRRMGLGALGSESISKAIQATTGLVSVELNPHAEPGLLRWALVWDALAH
jgi:hypothetical protein